MAQEVWVAALFVILVCALLSAICYDLPLWKHPLNLVWVSRLHIWEWPGAGLPAPTAICIYLQGVLSLCFVWRGAWFNLCAKDLLIECRVAGKEGLPVDKFLWGRQFGDDGDGPFRSTKNVQEFKLCGRWKNASLHQDREIQRPCEALL